MKFRPRSLLLAGLVGAALTLPGCYAMALDEFDSVAGWDNPLEEPATVAWASSPKQYPWHAFVSGAAPVASELDNPSGYARERLEDLIYDTGVDPSRIAQVTRRLLWVLEKDSNSYNRIAALRGMESILQRLGGDLLDADNYFQEATAEEGLALSARFRAAHESIVRLVGRKDRSVLSDADRQAYLKALADYTERPVPRATWRRKLIRTIWSVYVVERDPVVRATVTGALTRAVVYAICNGLRTALVPLDEQDFPVVRMTALRVYRRLGGIPALPFVLKMMSAPAGAAPDYRYDRDSKVRMSLVRMCAQLRYEHAIQGEPRPLEFLYETAVDPNEEEPVRRVALEGLARVLHERLGMRRVDLELDWAREWWKGYVVDRAGKAGG